MMSFSLIVWFACKNEREDREQHEEHRERLEQRPHESPDGAVVAGLEIRADEGPDEAAEPPVSPDAADRH